MRRPIVLLLLVLAKVSPLLSQAPSTWTFADFSTTVGTLSFNIPPTSTEFKTLDSISSALNDIRTGYLGKYGNGADTATMISADLSSEYSSSMADDLNALKTLPTGTTDRLAALQEVRDDLKVKAKTVAAASGAGLVADAFPSTIQLTLSVTLSAGSNINPSDVSIRANPHHFGTKPPPAYILGNGTAPQSGRLPPGRFEIWVEAHGHVLKVQDWDIGENGTATQAITFNL
jgi:hypothetical protein